MDAVRISVIEKLFDTIDDPESWHVALGALCGAVGAKKAIISLRHYPSAEIVVPSIVEEEHNSPLLFGFTEDEVGAFLTDFYDVDPWTPIEREKHPYTPYPLSRYLSDQALVKSRFWDWLHPQGINDSMVAEVGFTEDNWAAINLYFHRDSREEAEAKTRLLEAYLPWIRKVWKIGRELWLARLRINPELTLINALEQPALVLTQDLRLMGWNSAAADLAKSGLIRNMRLNEVPLVPLDLSVMRDPKLDVSLPTFDPDEGEITLPPHSAVLNPIRLAEHMSGEQLGSLLLTLMPNTDHLVRQKAAVWEHPDLTQQESRLVRLYAHGAQVTDVMDELGVSRTRIMQIWRSARAKLGIERKVQLQVIHESRSNR